MREEPDDYIKPDLGKDRFTCPQCLMVASQGKLYLYAQQTLMSEQPTDFVGTECSNCGGVAIWWNLELRWPPTQTPEKYVPPPPSERLSRECNRDYEEARKIFAHSPRSSLALLWLLLNVLCENIAPTQATLQQKVLMLLKGGSSDPDLCLIFQSVCASSANHRDPLWTVSPHGQATNAREAALALFHVVNHIADKM